MVVSALSRAPPLIILGLCLLVHVSPQIVTSRAVVVMLAGALPIIIMAAAALHYLLEAPLMRVGRRLTHRKPVPAQHSELKKIN
jgi:peptidoglycan/LPS O-acetylase OafA/YrhL